MIAAAGLLLRALDTGRTLMLLRPEGAWSFPGGFVEPGETELQAAVRELREETGYAGAVSVDVASAPAVVWNLRNGPPALDPPTQLRGVVVAYVVFLASVAREFVPVLDGENVAACWVALESVPAIPVHPGVPLALRAFSGARGSAPSH